MFGDVMSLVGYTIATYFGSASLDHWPHSGCGHFFFALFDGSLVRSTLAIEEKVHCTKARNILPAHVSCEIRRAIGLHARRPISHRFAPHDPYYSGGSGGGGGYEGNFRNNISFDQHSEHSIHSDRNRVEGSYAGSREASKAPPGSDPHQSGNYVDHYGEHSDHHYHDNIPRYNGGVHYPEDTYSRKPPSDDYMDQHYADQHGGRALYNDHDEHGYSDDLEPPRPEDYREIQNRSKGPHEDPYAGLVPATAS
ncbi:hypothetical protein Btru_035068 [Bulinus truncatus]|nr:hypothetical protein Btru_035068 [Bulinus truncatus]